MNKLWYSKVRFEVQYHVVSCNLQVAECGTREFTDQKRVEMSVSEFVDQWLELFSGHNALTDECNGKSLLYLKDWHFVKV